MKTWVTRFDEELLQKSKTFLRAAAEQPESRKLLEQFGFDNDEQARGQLLATNTERSFQWEREGRAWNFLSPTVDQRLAEAQHWFKDARKRHKNECFRSAEEAKGLFAKLREVRRMYSRTVKREQRVQLAKDLAAARGDKPEGAPPPKDTALVELQGYYERWRLLAQRVFRERPDMMAPYGLTPGKAPPRLRGKLARLKYGEGAAGRLEGAAPAEPDDAAEEPRRALPVVR